MAKPNDTRITHVPANHSNTNNTSNTSNTSNTNNKPGSATALPVLFEPLIETLLEALVETLRKRQEQAAPVMPKSARRPRIRSRRHVTVGASFSPDSIVEIPTLRMCGHWLVPAGFGLGTRAQVHVARGVLLLIAEGGDN
jgi:hypothetical protein